MTNLNRKARVAAKKKQKKADKFVMGIQLSEQFRGFFGEGAGRLASGLLNYAMKEIWPQMPADQRRRNACEVAVGGSGDSKVNVIIEWDMDANQVAMAFSSEVDMEAAGVSWSISGLTPDATLGDYHVPRMTDQMAAEAREILERNAYIDQGCGEQALAAMIHAVPKVQHFAGVALYELQIGSRRVRIVPDNADLMAPEADYQSDILVRMTMADKKTVRFCGWRQALDTPPDALRDMEELIPLLRQEYDASGIFESVAAVPRHPEAVHWS